MKDKLQLIISGIAIFGFLAGGITGYAKIQSKTEAQEKKVEELSEKVEDVSKENTELDKAVGEFKVEQKYIKEGIDDLKELVKELKRGQ